jgi:hypothetical protein
MAGWLATLFFIGFTVTVALRKFHHMGGLDNSAHFGGTVSGAVIAALWRRGVTTPTSTKLSVFGLCAAIMVACALRVFITDTHPTQYPFATMYADERLADAAKAREHAHRAARGSPRRTELSLDVPLSGRDCEREEPASPKLRARLSGSAPGPRPNPSDCQHAYKMGGLPECRAAPLGLSACLQNGRMAEANSDPPADVAARPETLASSDR